MALVGYRYPMITTYASTPDDEVYNLVKAIDETFDTFKNTTASSVNWEVKRSIRRRRMRRSMKVPSGMPRRRGIGPRKRRSGRTNVSPGWRP